MSKPYYLFGLGAAGSAAAEYLTAHAFYFFAWDDNESARNIFPYPEKLTPPDTVDFKTLKALVLSPGIPHSLPVPHPAAIKAQAAGVPIVCDTDILFETNPDATIIGVTGTNGKSTTTALLGHILNWPAGGNLGRPSLSLPGDRLVIEFSSFMLERVPHLKTDIGIHLNFTPDHFDRHGDMAGYMAAKLHLFDAAKGLKVALIGVDDPESRAFLETIRNRNLFTVYPVSVLTKQPDGFWVQDGVLYKGDTALLSFTDHPRLKGRHNWQNMAFAVAAAFINGLPLETIRTRLHQFAGLPHRQFLTRTIGNIAYINDSKATNADATVQALAAYDGIHWLAGGKPKAGGLSGCEAYLARVRHAYLYGYAAKEFAAYCQMYAVPHTAFTTMTDALNAAHIAAQNDPLAQAVLLSPACASYDQFKNFEERGDLFCQFVQNLEA